MILTKLKSERVDQSKTPNPTMTKLREELQSQQTRIVGLRSSFEQKTQQRNEMTRHARQRTAGT